MPPSPTASIRARVSSDSVRRLIRSASSESRLRKCSRASGSSLAPRAQDLDRARDPGDRVAQLVGGVGDELALGDLAAQLLGAVADDRQHRALGRQLAGVERVDAVADPQRVVLGHGPRARRRRSHGTSGADRLAVGADQVPRGGVGEAHLAVGLDHHDRVGERLEDRREPVALLAQGAERLAQGAAHRLQRPAEVGDLVAPAGALERLVELALADPRGALGEPLDPRGDRARDQERDQDRDRDARPPSAVRRSPRSSSIASWTSGARSSAPRIAPSIAPSRKIGTATTVTPPGSSST